VRYRFEPMKLRLADLAFYTPDFEVELPDVTIEFHEVKPGYRQKLKGSREVGCLGRSGGRRKSLLKPGAGEALGFKRADDPTHV